jgi:hypothetical protein
MSLIKHHSASLLVTVGLVQRSSVETTIDGKFQFTIGALTYRNVVVQGLVIAKRSYPKHDMLIGRRQVVDDGTGVITCIKWGAVNHISLGDLVRVQGSLSIYDNDIQLVTHKRVCKLQHRSTADC